MSYCTLISYRMINTKRRYAAQSFAACICHNLQSFRICKFLTKRYYYSSKCNDAQRNRKSTVEHTMDTRVPIFLFYGFNAYIKVNI